MTWRDEPVQRDQEDRAGDGRDRDRDQMHAPGEFVAAPDDDRDDPEPGQRSATPTAAPAARHSVVP